MSRIEGLRDAEAGFVKRQIFKTAAKQVGDVPEPLRVMARSGGTMWAAGLFQMAFDRATTVEPRLKTLASLKAHLGDLSKVKRVVRVFGMVNSDSDFVGQSGVMNGASQFLQEVFGERGRHVRSAVGMASLPVNLTVEIEMVFEVESN